MDFSISCLPNKYNKVLWERKGKGGPLNRENMSEITNVNYDCEY